MQNYPIAYTWAELAEMPNAADCFCWDDEQASLDEGNLAGRICSYSSYLIPTPGYGRLAQYLTDLGFVVTEEGVTVPSRDVLVLANVLTHRVMTEYDDDTSPTWDLFQLTGDDSVDYFGTQPSCLTNLLMSLD
jgi:hypothetical protein